MRLLVACHRCHRQYDASRLKVGARFRCRCGEVLTVVAPAPKDSAVVRCSSCGAPRQEQQLRCAFCGADFTLREQDLNTICPHCFARVSDHAKFCDHCGTQLRASPLNVTETPLDCPSCGAGHRLSSRMIEGVSVLECHVCAGIWVDQATFGELVSHAAQEASRGDDRSPAQAIHPDGAQHRSNGHRYLPCPVCHGLMVPQNFAHRSGIIINLCKSHGVWFDGEKLQLILDWIRSGGLAAANAEAERTLAENQSASERARYPHSVLLTDPHDSGIPNIFPGIINSLFDIFR